MSTDPPFPPAFHSTRSMQHAKPIKHLRILHNDQATPQPDAIWLDARAGVTNTSPTMPAFGAPRASVVRRVTEWLNGLPDHPESESDEDPNKDTHPDATDDWNGICPLDVYKGPSTPAYGAHIPECTLCADPAPAPAPRAPPSRHASYAPLPSYSAPLPSPLALFLHYTGPVAFPGVRLTDLASAAPVPARPWSAVSHPPTRGLLQHFLCMRVTVDWPGYFVPGTCVARRAGDAPFTPRELGRFAAQQIAARLEWLAREVGTWPLLPPLVHGAQCVRGLVVEDLALLALSPTTPGHGMVSWHAHMVARAVDKARGV